jgi:hypothetical protein
MLDVEVMLESRRNGATELFASRAILREDERAGVLNDSLILVFGGKKLPRA